MDISVHHCLWSECLRRFGVSPAEGPTPASPTVIFAPIEIGSGITLRAISKPGRFSVFGATKSGRVARADIDVENLHVTSSAPADCGATPDLLRSWRLKVDVSLVAPLRCGAAVAVLERMPASVGQLVCLFLLPQDLSASAAACRTLAGWSNDDLIWGRVLDRWAAKRDELSTCVAAAVARQTEPQASSSADHETHIRVEASHGGEASDGGKAGGLRAATSGDSSQGGAGQPGPPAGTRWCRNWQAARLVTLWVAEKRAADAAAEKDAVAERARRAAGGRYGSGGIGSGGGSGAGPGVPHLPTFSPPLPPLLGPSRGPFDLPMPFEHGGSALGRGVAVGRGLGAPPLGGAGLCGAGGLGGGLGGGFGGGFGPI